MEENSKNSAWFRVILLIAAIPLCIYMKADFFNAVIYMFTLFLMGFRSKGSGAVKNIGMLMSLISPALLFMSAPVWIMGTYAAIVGVCVHMHSRRYPLLYTVCTRLPVPLHLHNPKRLACCYSTD